MLNQDLIAERQRLVAARQPGFSLPGAFFTSDALFALDEQLFRRNWIYAGTVADLPESGSFFTFDLFRDPIVVVRGRDGRVRAFHNICRHHGAKICLADRGQVGRLHCTYHHWAYGLDGQLIAARNMPEGFDAARYPLKPVAVEIMQGMIFVCLAADPPDFDAFRDGVSPYVAPHAELRTKVAHRSTIVEKANWKLVIENNRECYHCPGNHPEFLTASFETALPDDPRANVDFAALLADRRAEWDALGLPHRPVDGGVDFRCLRMPLKREFLSFTLDGGAACGKLLGDLASPRLGSVRLFRPPNVWNHFLADHIIHFRVLPLSPTATQLETVWLVHEDAVEGVDYDVERLTHVWLATNDQDRGLVEMNQAAIASSAYEPGPQGVEEFLVADFQDWYFRELAAL